MMLYDFEFSLALRGRALLDEEAVLDLADEVGQALDAAGADVSVAIRDGVVSLMVSREASTFEEAILVALREVERLPGIEVVHVGPDALVTATEIADRLGVTRQAIQLMINGQRGPGGFPAPLLGLSSRQRVWRWLDVVEWLGDRHGSGPAERARAAVIARINHGLEARRLGLSETLGMAASALTRIVQFPSKGESPESAALALRRALPLLRATPGLDQVVHQAEQVLLSRVP
jgi:hypothetical protein